MRLRCVVAVSSCWFACASGVGLAAAAKPAVATGKRSAPQKPAAKSAAGFDELLADAEPVVDLAAVIEPLFDTCDSADALEHRRCAGAREFLEAQAREKLYVAVGDVAALTVTPYDPVSKEVDFEVQGCLACLHPPQLSDGKGGQVRRFVTTRVPRAIKGGRAIGLDLGTLPLVITTPEAEAKWKKQEKKVVPRLRVQFLFKLGEAWSSGDFSGVSFVPVAHRVFDACTGEVFATSGASPAAAAATKVTAPALQPGDALRCPAPGQDLTTEELAEKEEIAKRPALLSREEIERGMAAVQERVHDCHVEFEESGTVNLRLVVEGPSGRVKEVHVLPPFDKTPAGLCIRAAIKDAGFTKFRTATQEVKVPVYLR